MPCKVVPTMAMGLRRRKRSDSLPEITLQRTIIAAWTSVERKINRGTSAASNFNTSSSRKGW